MVAMLLTLTIGDTCTLTSTHTLTFMPRPKDEETCSHTRASSFHPNAWIQIVEIYIRTSVERGREGGREREVDLL